MNQDVNLKINQIIYKLASIILNLWSRSNLILDSKQKIDFFIQILQKVTF